MNPIENHLQLAEWLHDTYEELAKEKGWETQERTKVPFDKLPMENKKVMFAIAVKIIELHKGTLTFVTRPGKTTFSVFLPI